MQPIIKFNGVDVDFNELVGTAQSPRPRVRRVSQNPATPEPPIVDISEPRQGARAWAETDGKFWATPSSHGVLPVGVYRLGLANNLGAIFLRQANDTDALVPLPDSESAAIVSEIQVFKTLKPKFIQHGFLYKRGILLWGPPGSGKTCTLQLIAKLLMDEHDSVMVLVDEPSVAAECLQTLRRIEPERQIVAVLEDLDALCERYGESEYLALLDGESQIDNIVWIASTNYPERLDRRFVDRPSRFDTVRYIGMPSAAARATYLQAKMPDVPGALLDQYVACSNGFSIAHLRELIILTRCFGQSVDEAAKRLSKSKEVKPSSERTPDQPEFGFARREER